MRLKVKTISLIILAVTLFALKIGSYFPNSLNDILLDILQKQIPDVSVERVTSGILWRYDAILSPFSHKKFRRKESLFYIYPVVYKSPRSEKIVLPMRPVLMTSVFGATVKRIPYDITYLKFSDDMERLLSRLRRLYKEDKILPVNLGDLDKVVRYAIGNGYGVMIPQYLSWMIPKDYEKLSCREFFKLSKPCAHVWVNLYSNSNTAVNKIISAIIASRNDLKTLNLSQKSKSSDSITSICRDRCRRYVNSLMFLTFFTNRDVRTIKREFEYAVNREIWRSRFFEKPYLMTYLLLGLFVMFTLDYKMIRYVKYVKSGGRRRYSMYILASVIVLISFVGVMPSIDPTVSKILFLSITASIAILDFISENRKWWLPTVLSAGVLAVGIPNDEIFTAIDVPFLLAAFAYTNERSPFRWVFTSLAVFFYIAAKRAGHSVYIIPSLIFVVMLFEYFVREFSRSKKEGWRSSQIERPIFIFKLMHPILFTIVFYLMFSVFSVSFTRYESSIENTMYLERKMSVVLSNSFDKIAFPCAKISLRNDRVIVNVNDPKVKDVRSFDMGFMVNKGVSAYFGYVPDMIVLKRTLISSSGHILIMIVILIANIAMYIYLEKYTIFSRRDLTKALVSKDKEYDEMIKLLENSLRSKEKSWKTILKILDLFDPNLEVIEILKSVSVHIMELEFVEKVWVARLTEDGWISTDGERVTVPIPDLKIDPDNRLAISLKHKGDVYALVSKLKGEEDYDLHLFKALKTSMEKFVRFAEGLKEG